MAIKTSVYNSRVVDFLYDAVFPKRLVFVLIGADATFFIDTYVSLGCCAGSLVEVIVFVFEERHAVRLKRK